MFVRHTDDMTLKTRQRRSAASAGDHSPRIYSGRRAVIVRVSGASAFSFLLYDVTSALTNDMKSPSDGGSASIEKAEVEAIEYRIEDDGAKRADGEEVLPIPPALTPEEEKKLWRKVDRRILPILTIMYLCSFLDRGDA